MEIYPSVSIIIPVYNGEKTISLCLQSLLKLDYPKDKLEILVVDNNSIDKTKAIIAGYPVKYKFEKKKGQPAALNSGIRASKGEIIAITDCDCVAHPGWIKELVKPFEENEKIGGCGGEIQPYRPSNLIEIYTVISMHQIPKMAISGKVYSFPFIMTGNCAYRRKVLYDVGLYDENIIGAEDRDIAARVSLKGYSLKYVEKAIVFHKYRGELKAVLMQRFKYGYGLSLINRKYYSLIDEKYKRMSNELKRFLILIHSASKELLAATNPDHNYTAVRKSKYFAFHACLRLAFIIGLIWPKPSPGIKSRF